MLVPVVYFDGSLHLILIACPLRLIQHSEIVEKEIGITFEVFVPSLLRLPAISMKYIARKSKVSCTGTCSSDTIERS